MSLLKAFGVLKVEFLNFLHYFDILMISYGYSICVMAILADMQAIDKYNIIDTIDRNAIISFIDCLTRCSSKTFSLKISL